MTIIRHISAPVSWRNPLKNVSKWHCIPSTCPSKLTRFYHHDLIMCTVSSCVYNASMAMWCSNYFIDHWIIRSHICSNGITYKTSEISTSWCSRWKLVYMSLVNVVSMYPSSTKCNTTRTYHKFAKNVHSKPNSEYTPYETSSELGKIKIYENTNCIEYIVE